jgi:competence protein ComEC
MGKKNFASVILFILFSLNVLAWIVVYDLSRPQFLEVTFFDIGQGESCFIETPQGHQILLDGGPNEAVLKKLGKKMSFYDRTIDLVILTHPHSDHLRGLISVLEGYQVENILWTGVNYQSQLYQEWQKMIGEEGAKIYIAQAGQRIISPEVVLEILYPFEILEGEEAEDLNDTSINVRLIFGEKPFLFTGDVSREIELALTKEFQEGLKSNVLKVAHQGSRTSSAQEFIGQVLPEIAVISVGKDNSYGHPHSETLDTLEKYDITVLRTDRDGDIKIISDGKKLRIAP